MELCDFLAEDELIEIVPNFKYERQLNLITGSYGPFFPAIPVNVPLWMALNLYQQQKCKINLPEWISEIDKLNDEQSTSESLIKMPSKHWREIIKFLVSNGIPVPESHEALACRRDNIIQLSVKSLLANVIDFEEDKISQVSIKNITKFELTELKKLALANLTQSKNLQ